MIAQAHKLSALNALDKAKHMNSPFEFVSTVAQLNQNKSAFFERIITNSAISQAFKNLLVSKISISTEIFTSEPCISDLILVKLLDKVWNQIFIASLDQDLVNCFKYEAFLCHTVAHCDSSDEKSHSLLQAFELLHSFNPTISQEVEHFMKLAIISFMTEVFTHSCTLKTFAKALRIYEKKDLVPTSMKSFYYNLRASFIQKIFAKEFT